MKSTLLRPAALAVLALGLAACGGGGDDDEGDYTVMGRFLLANGDPGGLLYNGLTLINGGDTIYIAPNATTFRFPKKLDYGDVYEVKIGNQPEHQTCDIVAPNLDGVDGRDVAGRLTAIDVIVSCSINRSNVVVSIPKPIAGTVITNGSTGGSYTITEGQTSATFSVQYGDAYGITILTQPSTGGPCRIENGVGVMGDLPITNVSLICP